MTGWYIKRTTGARVFLIGHHPAMDKVAVTSGENDVRWISYSHFIEFFQLLDNE